MKNLYANLTQASHPFKNILISFWQGLFLEICKSIFCRSMLAFIPEIFHRQREPILVQLQLQSSINTSLIHLRIILFHKPFLDPGHRLVTQLLILELWLFPIPKLMKWKLSPDFFTIKSCGLIYFLRFLTFGKRVTIFLSKGWSQMTLFYSPQGKLDF